MFFYCNTLPTATSDRFHPSGRDTSAGGHRRACTWIGGRARISLSPHGLASFHNFLSGPWRRIATPVDGCMPGWRFRPAARSAASIRCRAPPLLNFPGVGSLRLTGTAAGLWRHRSRVYVTVLTRFVSDLFRQNNSNDLGSHCTRFGSTSQILDARNI